MAALLVRTRTRTVGPPSQGIGEIKLLYENELKRRGYANVVLTPSEVAGDKAGCRLSIMHLPHAGANFYELFAVAGDTVPAAQGVLDEASGIVFHIL